MSKLTSPIKHTKTHVQNHQTYPQTQKHTIILQKTPNQTPTQQLLQNKTNHNNRKQKRTRHNQPKQTLHKPKNQNTQNHFPTNPKQTTKNPPQQAKQLLLQEAIKQPQTPQLTPNTEHRSIDDTVCRKYSTNTKNGLLQPLFNYG